MTTYPPIPTHSARAAAAAYLARGRYPVPVPVRQKGPILPAWPDLRLTVADLPRYFPDDRSMNLGLLLIGLLADLDLDAVEAVKAGNVWLPRTSWVSGRAGKPFSHHWFRADGPIAYASYSFLDGSKVLELRTGAGLQTVAPPGTHADGDEIVWHTFAGDPAVVPATDLTRLAGETAALALLMRYWPAKGGRNDAHLGLIGTLLRAGWSVQRVEKIVAALARITDDEQANARVALVADSAERLKAGKAVRGFKYLTGALGKDGEEVARRAQEWLGLPPDPRVTFTTGGG
ncbi:MAG TPA: bifunctional DNA primase/polymerase, partial [Gemmataceae bacterium]|nr:bifunctional DNA primase/polymerase [Gemmataceae bacterium]